MGNPRRRFLKTLGAGAAAAAGGASLVWCGGGSSPTGPVTPTATPTPAPEVIQRLIVRNSDMTELGELTVNGRAGEIVQVSLDTLVAAGIDTSVIDPSYFAVKNTDGTHVAAGGGGVVPFPASAQDRIVYGMNAQNGLNYSPGFYTLGTFINRNLASLTKVGKNVTVRFFRPGDVFTANPAYQIEDGDPSIVGAIVGQYAEAVAPLGMTIRWDPDNPEAEVSGGFASNLPVGWAGANNSRTGEFVADHRFLDAPDPRAWRVINEEAGECIFGYQNWGDRNSMVTTSDAEGNLTPAGRDLVRAIVLVTL